jgi:hypothetical protein
MSFMVVSHDQLLPDFCILSPADALDAHLQK